MISKKETNIDRFDINRMSIQNYLYTQKQFSFMKDLFIKEYQSSYYSNIHLRKSYLKIQIRKDLKIKNFQIINIFMITEFTFNYCISYK